MLPFEFPRRISRLMTGYYFKEHEPDSLLRLYLLCTLTGAVEDVPAGRNLKIAEKSVPVSFLSGNLKKSTFQDCKIQTVSQFLYLYI